MSRNVFILGSFLLVCPSLVLAAPSYQYAYLSFVEGELTVQRAAEPEPEPGSVNMPILPGDRIWTLAASRAEVRLNGGSRLRLDKNTKLDFVELDSETIVRLWNGSAILKLTDAEGSVRIDSPAGSIRPTMPGTYRIDVEEGSRVTLSVAQGAAELASTVGAVMVESGQTSHVTQGEAPDIARPFNTASFDEFDAWSDRRDQGASIVRNLGGRSVPYEVESHVSDLSSYGDWTTDSAYGTVWYPNVGLGWSPYSSGRWCYTRFGYTWASNEPWGWAPYHYGRWGYNPRGWYWMPGSVWSPAWVSFAFGPYWVGWSPLGHHNRPVFGFDSHFRGHGGRRFAKPGHHWGGPSDRGSGWNFASHDQFRGRSGGMRRLDENLIRETAPRARLFESGAVLDRDLRPRGSRETWGDSPGVLRFAERRSQSGSRARVEPGVRTLNRTETPSMPRAFTAPSENARGRSAADRPSSGTPTVSPWMRSRSNDSDPRSGRSSWNGSTASRERRDTFPSAMGRRSSTEPPRATVVPPRGNAPSSPRGTAPPSWRTTGRGGSSGGRASSQRQSFDRGSRPSSSWSSPSSSRSSSRESSQRQSFDRGSRPSSSWSSPSSSRSSSRAATSRGSSRGSDRGGGGRGSSRNSGGGRSRSNRN